MKTLCSAVLLIVVNAHAAVLWDNGQNDWRYLLPSERDAPSGEASTADDAFVPAAIITELHFQFEQYIWMETDVAGLDWAIYAHTGDGPGPIVHEGRNWPFKYKTIDYIPPQIVIQDCFVDDLYVRLPAGPYYFTMRLVDSGYFVGALCSTGDGKLKGITGAYVKWPENGLPDWTYTGDLEAATDVAFSIVGYVIGDLNCDGAVDGADIEPFFLALAWPDKYTQQHPDCDLNLADVNCDEVVDGADIDPFFALLGG